MCERLLALQVCAEKTWAHTHTDTHTRSHNCCCSTTSTYQALNRSEHVKTHNTKLSSSATAQRHLRHEYPRGSPNAWRARSATCTHGASRTETSKRRISSSPPTLPAMTRALFLSILAPRDASNQATSVAQASLALWLICRRRFSRGMAMVCTSIGGRLACCFMRRMRQASVFAGRSL